MNTRNHKGITYIGSQISGPKHIKWDGGPVGGIVFENPAYGFGTASDWQLSFEEAADKSIASCRKTYEIAKRRVTEYEAACDVALHKIAADLKEEFLK